MGISIILAVLLIVGIAIVILGFVNKKDILKKIGSGICLILILAFLFITYLGTINM